MIDIISLSIAVGAILVALTTHIKFSRCWGFEMITRTPTKSSPPETPNILETQPLLQHSPAILIPSEHSPDSCKLKISEPINIQNKRKIIKNWL